MKQILSFKKDITFNTKIGEITSISLEHNLKITEPDHITGDFIISGDYKITDISVNREPFSYNLPFDITLDSKYDTNKARIDIDDFYYEIINEQILNVNIDVLIDGIEIIDEYDHPIEENNEIDVEINDNSIEGVRNESIKINEEDEDLEKVERIDEFDNYFSDDNKRDVMNLFKEDEVPPIDVAIENNNPSEDKIKSLFDSFDDKNETFTTYHVHIVRENDTIESIVAKYKTTKEEIAAYNKIDELKLGDKIVIPASSNE